jgi:hypothetical protein
MLADAVPSSEHSTDEQTCCLFTLKAQKSNLLTLSTQTINKNKERERYQMRSHVALQRAQEKGKKSTYLRRKY